MAVLGTIELSADILEKTDIGLWAFELDPGAAPRMYVNDTMLHLIGLEKQTTPEMTYHAWYDHVDPDHYAEVNASVDKMITGVHAEVQYPWHHPDGRIMTVRCGGVRNFLYTKGVRIEGTHMDVSDVAHFQKQNLAGLLSKLSDNFLNVYFLDPYTGQFEEYTRSSAIDNEAVTSVSHKDFFSYIEEQNLKLIHPDDVKSFSEMFAQSNLINILETGLVSEYTARWKHEKDDAFRFMRSKLSVFEENDGTKKLIIGVKDVTKERINEIQLEEKLQIVEALTQDYDYVDIVELRDNKLEDTCVHYRTPSREDRYVPGWHEDIPYTQKLDQICEYMVMSEDRENFKKQTRRELILDRLKRNNVHYANFRIVTYGIIHYAQLKFTGMKDASGNIVRLLVAYINADKQVLIQKELQDRVLAAGRQIDGLKQERANRLSALNENICKPVKQLLDSDCEALINIGNHNLVREKLKSINRDCRHLLTSLDELVLEPLRNNPESKPNDVSVLKGKYFLLAEDNALNREIAKDFFEEYGVTIEELENGKLIVKKCKEILESDTAKRPDLILMDCQMPVMDGYEATRRICELMSEHGERIPIVAMTANAFEEEKKRCLECGMRDHVAKPIDRNEIEQTLLKYLN